VVGREAAHGGSGGVYGPAVVPDPQERGFDLSADEDEDAALEVLAEEVAEDRGAAQGLDGDRTALPHRDGAQGSEAGSLFEGGGKGVRPGAELKPADAEPEGAGGGEERGETLRDFVHPEEMGGLHAVSG
jgi:hypothetical protein